MTITEYEEVTDNLFGCMRDIASGIGRVVTQEEAREFVTWLLHTERAARRVMGVT